MQENENEIHSYKKNEAQATNNLIR